MTTSAPIAITAGRGKIGARVAARLDDLDRPHRIGSRSGAPPFDWADSSSWAPFLDGCTAVVVIYIPDIGFPGAAETLAAFGSACRTAGVTDAVLVSGRGEPGAAESEARLAAVLPELTIVRCSWFAQNFSESFFLGPVLGGAIALPAGDVVEPFLDADDIADVVVECVTEPRHRGATLELTGPDLLGFSDVAAQISSVTGREVTYRAVSVDDYVAGAVAAGVPDEEARAYANLFAQITDGRNAHTTPDVETVLGRPPRSFAAYAGRTATTGVWNP